MPEAAAAIDASPLILLSRISRLDLLLTLKRRLVIPVPVLEEIRAKGDEDPTVRAVERAVYLGEVPALSVSEAIAGGISVKASPRCSHGPRDTAGHWALLDDMETRRCAESQGIPLLKDLILLVGKLEMEVATALAGDGPMTRSPEVSGWCRLSLLGGGGPMLDASAPVGSGRTGRATGGRGELIRAGSLLAAAVLCLSVSSVADKAPDRAVGRRVAAGGARNRGEAAGTRLPTGLRLDPAGRSFDVGNMPLSMVAAPEGDRVVVLLNGWRQQGVQVMEVATGRVLQTLQQPAAFLGVAFSPDGHTLYASGGYEDLVYRYDWRDGAARLRDSIDLGARPEAVAAGGAAVGGEKTGGEARVEGVGEGGEAPANPASKEPAAAGAKKVKGEHYPAGLAPAPDGRTLYVAENLSDTLAAVDLQSGRVIQRLPAGPYPYGVAVAPDGAVYVSDWGGTAVAVFVPEGPVSGRLVEAGKIEVGRHPSALLLNASGSRLFVASASTDRVAVVDTRSRKMLKALADPPPAGPGEGSTPNGLALSAAGNRLYVAEADSNALAVFDLSPATAGARDGGGAAVSGMRSRSGRPASPDPAVRPDKLSGRIPCGWYPTAALELHGSLLVLNGKGRGTGPNPRMPQPGAGSSSSEPTSYTLGQTNGTVNVLPAAMSRAALAGYSSRVARANGWGARRRARAYPPFRHVVYIIKENRTYDQVLGDLAGGDGDPSLLFFPREVSPNHHALAERFGLYDRFFVNAEVSTQGHSWSTSAYVTDFVEKITPSGYSDRRKEEETSEVDEPATGALWDLARAKGIGLRVYGEFATEGKDASGRTIYKAQRPTLEPYVNPDYPAWDLGIPDQRRLDVWLAELKQFEAAGKMPALEIVWLPGDHTAGARPGLPTPKAYMADNDLALGRLVEALSRSSFWKSTVVFVLEDDAQAGPDHMDSHRSPFLVISPYSRPGAVHRFANTTDVVATIEEILGLGTLSQFDTFGRPLREVFAAAPDLRPYTALTPTQPLDEKNPSHSAGSAAAAADSRLDLTGPDRADEALFNRILWAALKGEDSPLPPPSRLSTLDLVRAR